MYKRLILVELILIEASCLESLPCYQLAQQVTYASHARESLILLIVLNLPQLPPPTISKHLEISLDEEERRDTYFGSRNRGETL